MAALHSRRRKLSPPGVDQPPCGEHGHHVRGMHMPCAGQRSARSADPRSVKQPKARLMKAMRSLNGNRALHDPIWTVSELALGQVFPPGATGVEHSYTPALRTVTTARQRQYRSATTPVSSRRYASTGLLAAVVVPRAGSGGIPMLKKPADLILPPRTCLADRDFRLSSTSRSAQSGQLRR